MLLEASEIPVAKAQPEIVHNPLKEIGGCYISPATVAKAYRLSC